MGKKSRGKRRYKQSPDKTSSSSANDPSSSPSKGALLQRLRHANATTRHAALSALAQNPRLFLNKGDVLSKVSELVVTSEDLHGSIAAAECLGNFLQLEHQNHPETTNEDQRTAGWLMLFLKRLNECSRHLTTAFTSDSGAIHLLWLQLTEECLRGMVLLLETNPVAVERLIRQVQHEARNEDDFWFITTQLLKPNPASIQIAMWVVRAWHAVWDDNAPLVRPFLNSLYATTTLQALRETMTFSNTMTHDLNTTDDSSTMLVRLHGCGAWLNLWLTLSWSDTVKVSEGIQSILDSHVSSCCQMLRQTLENFDPTIRLNPDKLHTTYARYRAQHEDQLLERDVVYAQDVKKESARSIARRLKTEQDSGRTGSSGKLLDDRQDLEEDWENTSMEWEHTIRPVQLALEIVANLTSTVRTIDGDMEDGNDDAIMHYDDLTLPEPLIEAITLCDFPLILMQFSQRMVSYNCVPAQDSDDPPDSLIRETLSDLFSKAIISLGHCVTNLPNIPDPSLWKFLKDISRMSNYNCTDAITSAMVATLRRFEVQDQVQEQDLNDLLGMLDHMKDDQQNLLVIRDVVCMLGILLCNAREHSACINETVCRALLDQAVLDQAVPNDTDSVCKLSQDNRSRSSAMILAEVLRVLMDIYGDDNCHPAVFESLDVLKFFQQATPTLKQKVSIAELSNNESLEDVEMWKETAMNAGRFIQYKKGHAI